MAEYFNGEFERLSNVNVTATAQNTVLAGEIDSSKSLKINGVSIAHSATAKVADLIKAINDKSGQTLVRAEWRGSEGLALTNIAGSEGANIEIGVTGSDDISAIGLAKARMPAHIRLPQLGKKGCSTLSPLKHRLWNAGSGFASAITRGGNPAQNVTIAAGSDTPEGIVAAINGATATTNVKATLVEDGASYRIALNNANGTLTDYRQHKRLGIHTGRFQRQHCGRYRPRVSRSQ